MENVGLNTSEHVEHKVEEHHSVEKSDDLCHIVDHFVDHSIIRMIMTAVYRFVK